jgi:E3 ubiquitin-protein ligase Topors
MATEVSTPNTTTNNNICPICLEPFESPTLLDSCFHKFCFLCITQWAQISQTCPLCKSWFRSLIYGIDKDTHTYKRLYLEDVKQFQKNKKIKTLSDSTAQIQQQSRRIIYAQKLRPVINFPLSKIPFPRPTTTDPTVSKRSLSFQNEENLRQSWLNKLSLWLQRELPILLSAENTEPNCNIEEEIKIITTVISGLLQQYGDLNLPQPKKELSEFFFEDTEQFIHELMTFLRSPYDMMTYDQKVIYIKPTTLENDTSDPTSRTSETTKENLLQNQQLSQNEANQQQTSKRSNEVTELSNKNKQNQNDNDPFVSEECNHAVKRQKTSPNQSSYK